MTEPLAEWIQARRPAPPPQLLARIEAMTAGVGEVELTADALLGAGERAMGRLLPGGCLTRESAIDLLAIDAIVTYAFEAAADDPDRLEARTGDALARIAALAAPYPT